MTTKTKTITTGQEVLHQEPALPVTPAAHGNARGGMGDDRGGVVNPRSTDHSDGNARGGMGDDRGGGINPRSTDNSDGNARGAMGDDRSENTPAQGRAADPDSVRGAAGNERGAAPTTPPVAPIRSTHTQE